MKYGVPQSRRRLVLLGSRHGDIRLLPQTHDPGTPHECYEKCGLAALRPAFANQTKQHESDHEQHDHR